MTTLAETLYRNALLIEALVCEKKKWAGTRAERIDHLVGLVNQHSLRALQGHITRAPRWPAVDAETIIEDLIRVYDPSTPKPAAKVGT